MNTMELIAAALTGSALDGMIDLLGGKERGEIVLKDDESFEDNCKFIKASMGTDDVHITKDMPSIYDRCGLDVGPASMMEKLDASMKLAVMQVMKDIKEKQEENDGFMSFSQLKKHFEGNEEIFLPIDADIETDKHLCDHAGWKFDLQGDVNMALMHRARQVMKDCVNEKGGMDIWDNMQINAEELCNIFGQTGVAVKDFESLFAAQHKVARVAIDIGIVRFPRIEDPFFRVHRFRVIVFKCKKRIICFHSANAGIFCRFQSRKYAMTEAWMDNFKPAIAARVHSKFADVMTGLGIDIGDEVA